MNKLSKYESRIAFDKYATRRTASLKELEKLEFWKPHRKLIEKVALPSNSEIKVDIADIISIRSSSVESTNFPEMIEKVSKSLMPWRIGPFNLFGIDIQSEWDSSSKWNRIEPFLSDISGRRVADVGCGNGYFLFRIAQEKPELAVGFDPNHRSYFQYQLLSRLIPSELIQYELMGIDDLVMFPEFFQTIVCMGVIYHRRDPYSALAAARSALSKNGVLILESLAIPGKEPLALCPVRYAKMRNAWFVPSEGCLNEWLRKVGFKSIETVSVVPTLPTEQRSTEYAPDESLRDFLDPEDSTKTVEGYPAPLRVTVVAIK